MNNNVGKEDKIVRGVLGVVLIFLALFVFEGLLRLLMLILAILLFITAFRGFCFLYTLLGINTCKLKDK